MDIQICEDRHISTHLQRFGATTDEIPLRSWRCLRYLDALPGGSLQGIYSDAAQHGRSGEDRDLRSRFAPLHISVCP